MAFNRISLIWLLSFLVFFEAVFLETQLSRIAEKPAPENLLSEKQISDNLKAVPEEFEKEATSSIEYK